MFGLADEKTLQSLKSSGGLHPSRDAAPVARRHLRPDSFPLSSLPGRIKPADQAGMPHDSPRMTATPAEAEPLVLDGDLPATAGVKSPRSRERAPAKVTQAEMLKWGSLLALVLQNSALFVVTRYTRSGAVKGRLYLTSVVVLLVELCKFFISNFCALSS